jgi:hypothetical protein
MIRARHAPRADSCCTSADVLTPTERVASRRDHSERVLDMVPRGTSHTLRWGDCPRIRAVLESIRGKS